MSKRLPSVGYLRECFVYNSITGELCWKNRPRQHFISKSRWSNWNKRYAGKIVGRGTKRGYRMTVLPGGPYLVYRIAWKLVTGVEPPETIDHIDGNPDNNSWTNLRAATQLEQMWNSRVRINNTSGYRGVVQSRGKWQAQIRVDGVKRFLGRFNTAEEAAVVVDAVAREVHGKFYREVP